MGCAASNDADDSFKKHKELRLPEINTASEYYVKPPNKP